MSEQLGEKHSAPAASPSREQGKKKKAKNQQTKLSFMPRTKAKDLLEFGSFQRKQHNDGTPFLQVRYEDGDTEEFVEEDLELLDELIEGRNMDINGLCHPRMFQSHLLQSLSLSDSQRDDGEWLQRRLIDHSSSN